MGEAKKKRENAVPTVYHHTSTLRTNLIWMSGVVQVEGKSEGAFHPHLGEIKTDSLMRRACEEFPPVAWFTTRIEIPECLIRSALFFIKETGEKKEIKIDTKISHAMTLNRVALGFRIADISVIPWPEYRGYKTKEGQEMNETAREVGDDPDEWCVSEEPVDVMKISEFWLSPSMFKPKLKRFDQYIEDIRKMVSLCRECEGAYIPPSWLTRKEAEMLVQQLKLPIKNFIE